MAFNIFTFQLKCHLPERTFLTTQYKVGHVCSFIALTTCYNYSFFNYLLSVPCSLLDAKLFHKIENISTVLTPITLSVAKKAAYNNLSQILLPPCYSEYHGWTTRICI